MGKLESSHDEAVEQWWLGVGGGLGRDRHQGQKRHAPTGLDLPAISNASAVEGAVRVIKRLRDCCPAQLRLLFDLQFIVCVCLSPVSGDSRLHPSVPREHGHGRRAALVHSATSPTTIAERPCIDRPALSLSRAWAASALASCTIPNSLAGAVQIRYATVLSRNCHPPHWLSQRPSSSVKHRAASV